jgi:hypothetical protein
VSDVLCSICGAAPAGVTHVCPSMRSDTFFPMNRKPGWPCPSCGGLGTCPNGKLSIGEDGVSFTPGTPCGTCLGFGRVKIVPFDEAERGKT